MESTSVCSPTLIVGAVNRVGPRFVNSVWHAVFRTRRAACVGTDQESRIWRTFWANASGV
jgi:hypothetical protein